MKAELNIVYTCCVCIWLIYNVRCCATKHIVSEELGELGKIKEDRTREKIKLAGLKVPSLHVAARL